MSNRKSHSVNRCVVTFGTFLSNFIQDFWIRLKSGRPNKMSSDMRSVPDLLVSGMPEEGSSDQVTLLCYAPLF